jgi:2-iminobutanoate/2-iminopropanoate deaminase
MTNLKHILEAAGSSLDQVVKTTVFLRDMNDFAAMNGVYAGFFTENSPARSTIQAAALPMGAAVEIEAVALVDN